MAEKTFNFSIVTPEKIFYSGDVLSIRIPAEKGYLGVLANHVPFFCEVKIGILRFKLPSHDEKFYSVTNGFMQVGHNSVTLYTEAIEAKDEIDANRAKTAYERARQRLKQRHDVDVERAEAALQRAENRIRLREKS